MLTTFKSLSSLMAMAAIISTAAHGGNPAAAFVPYAGEARVPVTGLVLVQSKSAPAATLTVTAAVTAAPGERAKLPIAVGAEAKSSNLFVMLHRVPAWLTVIGGDPVGAGVWLVPAARIEQTEVQVAAAAAGESSVQVSLLAADGTVARESAMRIVVSQALRGAQAAGATPAGPPPQAPLAKTWVGIVSEQAKTAETAQGNAASPAAAAPARVAQAAPAPRPAAAAPAQAGPRDEAAMVEYARYLVRECTTCHSLYGQDVGIPLMIGLPTERFIDTMRLYKTGRRDHPPMQSVAQALSDEETMALALYLGRIKAPTEPQAAARASSSTSSIPAASAASATPKRTATEAADRVARWIKRGEDLIASGDIGQARLVLERASDSGSARAAYLLGTSYDPNALPWRPGIGIDAEPLKAREWYLAAQRLGDATDAGRRLADLPAPR